MQCDDTISDTIAPNEHIEIEIDIGPLNHQYNERFVACPKGRRNNYAISSELRNYKGNTITQGSSCSNSQGTYLTTDSAWNQQYKLYLTINGAQNRTNNYKLTVVRNCTDSESWIDIISDDTNTTIPPSTTSSIYSTASDSISADAANNSGQSKSDDNTAFYVILGVLFGIIVLILVFVIVKTLIKKHVQKEISKLENHIRNDDTENTEKHEDTTDGKDVDIEGQKDTKEDTKDVTDLQWDYAYPKVHAAFELYCMRNNERCTHTKDLVSFANEKSDFNITYEDADAYLKARFQ